MPPHSSASADAANGHAAHSAAASHTRAAGGQWDFVPEVTGTHAQLGKHLLVFGAFLSKEEQVAPRPWAWDPVLFHLGHFDGQRFGTDGAAQQCVVLLLSCC